jgi:PadR family transcriptional regulator PadR
LGHAESFYGWRARRARPCSTALPILENPERTSTVSKAIKPRGISKRRTSEESSSLDLFSGDFIKLHVLHHASEQPVYGLWLIEELAEHGYRVSPGTLYPLLHSLELSQLLNSYNEVYEGKTRRYYRITANGRRQLKKAKLQLMELMGEILTKEEAERLATSFVLAG